MGAGPLEDVQARHNQGMDPSLPPIHQALIEALDAFVTGDGGPYKDLWAHTDDVSLMGAFGGRNVGWTEVGPRLDLAASQYRSGRYDDLEILASHAGADMAYVVSLETISAISADGEPVTRRRRVTHVFHLGGDEWRIVHQHSDPLVDLTIPPS